MKALVPTGLGFLLLLATPPVAQAGVKAERWMIVSIASAPLGYYHMQRSSNADGTLYERSKRR